MTIRTIRNARRRGMTTMEFALILPFIMVFVMGMIEVGTMFHSWLTLQKASQSGARFATTGQGEEQGTRLSQISQITQNWLTSLNNGDKEIVITSWPTPDVSGEGTTGSAGGPCQLVEVAVVYNYHPFTPIVGAMLPEVIELYAFDRKLNEPWKPCEEEPL